MNYFFYYTGLIFWIVFIFCAIAYLIIPFIERFPYFRLSKSHIQIGKTCLVWGGGLWSKDGKKFREINDFINDDRFTVKKYFGKYYILF